MPGVQPEGFVEHDHTVRAAIDISQPSCLVVLKGGDTDGEDSHASSHAISPGVIIVETRDSGSPGRECPELPLRFFTKVKILYLQAAV